MKLWTQQKFYKAKLMALRHANEQHSNEPHSNEPHSNETTF